MQKLENALRVKKVPGKGARRDPRQNARAVSQESAFWRKATWVPDGPPLQPMISSGYSCPPSPHSFGTGREFKSSLLAIAASRWAHLEPSVGRHLARGGEAK
jgi:hypothetical protein